jgi:chorismate mutase/prephenate dehydratase
MAKRKTGKKVADKKKPATGQSNAKLERALKRVDREILAKINERAEIEQQLAEFAGSETHAGNAKSAELFSRLDDLLSINKGPLASHAVRAVFREIVSGCRELVAPCKVAYLGPEYSYSHLAATERFGSTADLIPVGTIAAVFEEVEHGNVDYGLVPLENSTDGRITDTLDMFTRVRVQISGEVQLRIHHTLLGQGSRSQIKKVCSKPQALSQCRGWLAKNLPNADLVATTSTTVAAERAAAEKDVAAIASRQAGAQYGLQVLAANIEDNKANITRFAVIGDSSAARTGNDKTAMLFQLSHKPGALADAMNVFKRKRLNMTWIESFPLVGQPNEYLFFVELQGHEKDLRVRQALSTLGKKTELLEVLGSYASSKPVD